MKKLISIIKSIIVSIKIFVRVRFIYPYSIKFNKVKTIIPNSVINFGNNIVIDTGVKIDSHLKTIDDCVYIGSNTYIGLCSSIGKYTSISFDVKIGLAPHPLNYVSTSPVLYHKKRNYVKTNLYNEQENGLVEIGNDVLISANAIILSGIKIANGAVIGAGAFVNKDVPPYAIVAGVPAKIINYRFSAEVILQLQQLQWWNLSKEELLKHEAHFNNTELFLKNLNKVNL